MYLASQLDKFVLEITQMIKYECCLKFKKSLLKILVYHFVILLLMIKFVLFISKPKSMQDNIVYFDCG